jgi:hypothetical protein
VATPVKFQFQASKSVHAPGGLPGAVEKSLEQFQSQCAVNLKRGEATFQTVVTSPEEEVYFAIVLAGPFKSLELLKAALDTFASQPLVEQMRQLGIE